jgi:hypothetical protein
VYGGDNTNQSTQQQQQLQKSSVFNCTQQLTSSLTTNLT